MSRMPGTVLPLLLAAVIVGTGVDSGLHDEGRADIEALYRQLGADAGALGPATSGTRCSQRAQGCIREFESGRIAWSPRTGAQPTWGPVAQGWLDAGGERGDYGYPTAAPECGHAGCTQRFEQGRISFSADAGLQLLPAIDDPTDVRVVVNKQRPLGPATYEPADLVPADGQLLRREAAEALQRLQVDAAADGTPVTVVSGYRSAAVQDSLYRGYTARYGQAVADTLSARPGHSEHQTGLAVDIGNPDGACALLPCFDGTPAGRWAAEHAHRYGFVIRYPQGAESVTGYAYEPWHLRYVGTDLAERLHSSNAATLEEYLGLEAAPDY